MSILRITTPSRITLAVYLIFLMMMHPTFVVRLQVRLDGGLAARRMALHFAACADALVGLDVGAGGHLLQENFDRFRAFGTFKGKDAGRFQHEGAKLVDRAPFYHWPISPWGQV
jgi:hypothetical protein